MYYIYMVDVSGELSALQGSLRGKGRVWLGEVEALANPNPNLTLTLVLFLVQ